MKRPSLTAWIMIGLAAGIAFGAAFPAPAVKMGLLGTIFLRLIKSIIAPLLFGTLVCGIAGTGSVKTMGRIGGKAILYFETVTTIALFVGLGAVNLVQPGKGVRLPAGAAAGVAQTSSGLEQILEHTFPVSVVDSMARGEVLQIVVFAFLFGTACAAIGAKARPVVGICESLSAVMFQYTNYVMLLAPFGVFGAMAATVGEKGLGVLLNLGKLVGTLYAAEVFFVVVVFGAVTAIARIPLRRFIVHVRRPFAIAYSTASSEAALPTGARKRWNGLSAEPHCRLRVADRLQLQPGRLNAVLVPGGDVHCPGRRRSRAVRHAGGHDADADADQQRRSRRAPGLAGDPGWHAGDIQSPGGRDRADPGRGHAHGYVQDLREFAGELPGDGRRRALGRREVSRRSAGRGASGCRGIEQPPHTYTSPDIIRIWQSSL